VGVYVDPMMACVPNANWRWNESCHLLADTLDELHALAGRIGLKRAWFQSHGTFPHYDLTRPRRARAVAAGAIEIVWTRELAAKYLRPSSASSASRR
jgi:hypothetical protein